MNVLVKEESLKSIGDAIREKTGADQETKYLPSAMAAAISSIVTDTTLTPQTKEVSPSSDTQDVTADSGYQLSMVRVNPITSDLLYNLDNDFTAENIKEGVNLFGVEGEVKPSVDFSVVTATPDTVLLNKVFYNDKGEQDKGSIPFVEAGTPSINIDSGTGEITASVSQSTGYVQEATNTSTLELSTYSGEKVSPTLEDQTIVEAGVYTTSAVEVAGITSSLLASLDSDFVAENIVSGVDLFGLEGTAEVGGLDMTQISATAADVLEGKTFYTQDKTLTTGTIPTMEGCTITPGTTSKTAVPQGYYTTGDVIIDAISSLYKKVAVVTAVADSGTYIKFTHNLNTFAGTLNIVAHIIDPTVNSCTSTDVLGFSSDSGFYGISGNGPIHETIATSDGDSAYRLDYNLATTNYRRALQTITLQLSDSPATFRTDCTYRAIITVE